MNNMTPDEILVEIDKIRTKNKWMKDEKSKPLNDNEISSWVNTIEIFKDNLISIDNEFIVILEFKLPFSLQRIDVSIVYFSQGSIVFDIIDSNTNGLYIGYSN